MGDLYKALADPTRRTILDVLTDRDGQTLFEICNRLVMKHGIGASRQAISQHLDVLEEAGLVRTSRSGRYKFHAIDTSPLREIDDRWPQQSRPKGQADEDQSHQVFVDDQAKALDFYTDKLDSPRRPMCPPASSAG